MKHCSSLLSVILIIYALSSCDSSSSKTSLQISNPIELDKHTTKETLSKGAVFNISEQKHPRTLLTNEHLQLVIDRMYGPNKRPPYSRWFELIKNSADKNKSISLVDLALIYKATNNSLYKDKFIQRIPKQGVPSLTELYAIDIMFNDLSDTVKKNIMLRVAKNKKPWYWNSIKESQGKSKANWGYHDAYGVAPAYAYSAIFAGTSLEKNKNEKNFPFNAANYLKVVDEQLSSSGYFFKIENRIAGDSTYNNALIGDYGGMYDNFGYDSGEESYSLYLFLQHFNLTGESLFQQAMHDKYRAHFYQNMSYPHKVNNYSKQQRCRKGNSKSHLMALIWNTQTSYIKQPAHNTVTANTFLYKDPKMQYYANNGLQREFCKPPYKGMFWDLIYYDDALRESPPGDNLTATYFNGPGLVSMRSDWSDDASFAVFMAGEGISRRYEDANSFILSRKTDVIVNAGARIRFNADNKKHFWYSIRSASKNTLKIFDPKESFDIRQDGTTGPLHSGSPLVPSDNLGGQIHELPPSKIDGCYNTYQSCNSTEKRSGSAFPLGIYETANITKYEHFPGKYTYSVGDATAAYTRKIDYFEREFLFIRPDVFVIFDRVKSVNPSFKKVWTVHTVDEPEVEAKASDKSMGMKTYINQDEITIKNPKNNTFIDTLVPYNNKITIRGGNTVLAHTQKVHDIHNITLDIPRWLEVFVTGTNTKGKLIITGTSKDKANDTEEIVFDGRKQNFYSGKAKKITNNTLFDPSASWKIDQWVGYQVTIIDGGSRKNYPIEGNIEKALFGKFPQLVGRRYVINKAIANSYKHWKHIKSVKNIDMDIENITLSVPHYFDTIDAHGRLHSFSPHTDFKDDQYRSRKDLGRWTLEIEATEPQLLDNFLNVISLKDPGEQKPKSKLIESEKTYGAIIEKTLVVFAKDKRELTRLKLRGEGKINQGILINLKPNSEYYLTYKETGLNWKINLALTGHEKNKVLSSSMGVINFKNDTSRPN